jgi:glycosyltransferase involved in cell wall biosynthesis
VSAPWISVVVPAYNEEAGIADLLATLRSRMEAYQRPYEILVVDNGSQDRTVEIVEGLADEHLRVLRNEINRGKGFSVRRGMLDARGELRLLCDADCGPSLASLPEMLRAMEHADVIAGSRSAAGAQVDRQQPLRRRLVGWPFIALTRTLLREPTKDVYCGFKLWRDSAAEAAFSRQRLTGWVFDAEVLALARGLGYRVTEVGVAWADRRGSKLSIRQVLIPAVRELLAARSNVRAQLQAARQTRQRPVSTPDPADGSSEGAALVGDPAPATTRDTR